MLNIAYSTTRQWNCGDEFILFGCRHLLDKALGEHNAIIYNRNPDIRRLSRLNLEQAAQTGTTPVRLNDNSVKPDSDLSFADLACFAGSPEWYNFHCEVFYQRIIAASLPTVFLGLGTAPESLPAFEQEVLDRSSVVTVRDPSLLSSPVFKKVNAKYLPCPALLSAKSGIERHIGHNNRGGGKSRSDLCLWPVQRTVFQTTAHQTGMASVTITGICSSISLRSSEAVIKFQSSATISMSCPWRTVSSEGTKA